MKNTLENQYFPANAERLDVHCLESGCIGKYIPPLGSVQIQYYLAGRDGHQIHPCRVDWIDSVKINPFLVMMREWNFLALVVPMVQQTTPCFKQICKKYTHITDKFIYFLKFESFKSTLALRIFFVHHRPVDASLLWYSSRHAFLSQVQSLLHSVRKLAATKELKFWLNL